MIWCYDDYRNDDIFIKILRLSGLWDVKTRPPPQIKEFLTYTKPANNKIRREI